MHAWVRLRRQERWALVVIFGALIAVALLPLVHPVDVAVLEWLQDHGRGGARLLAHGLDEGARLALLLTAAVLAWHVRGRRMLRALVTFAGGAFVGELLKTAIERPRPSAAFGVLAGNSLPSGHIMNTTIAAALVCVLAVRTDWSRRTKGVVLVVAVLAVAAQAIGRVLHGSHWPSDVAPSVLLGVGWVLGTARWPEVGSRLRVAVALGCLGAYGLFYEMPSARLHLVAPSRPQVMDSHAAPAERAPRSGS
ncbi:MAG: phosphatase PAP2 family protein [Candidatus Binatia bacterium]